MLKHWININLDYGTVIYFKPLVHTIFGSENFTIKVSYGKKMEELPESSWQLCW